MRAPAPAIPVVTVSSTRARSTLGLWTWSYSFTGGCRLLLVGEHGEGERRASSSPIVEIAAARVVPSSPTTTTRLSFLDHPGGTGWCWSLCTPLLSRCWSLCPRLLPVLPLCIISIAAWSATGQRGFVWVDDSRSHASASAWHRRRTRLLSSAAPPSCPSSAHLVVEPGPSRWPLDLLLLPLLRVLATPRACNAPPPCSLAASISPRT